MPLPMIAKAGVLSSVTLMEVFSPAYLAASTSVICVMLGMRVKEKETLLSAWSHMVVVDFVGRFICRDARSCAPVSRDYCYRPEFVDILAVVSFDLT